MEKKISKNQKVYPHRFGCSQNHPKAPNFWVSWRIFTFGSGLWGSYQRYDKDMGSFCDFGWVRACHI